MTKASDLDCFSHLNLHEQTGQEPPHCAETTQISSQYPEHTFWTRGRNVLAQYWPDEQWPSWIKKSYVLVLDKQCNTKFNKILLSQNILLAQDMEFSTWVQLVQRPPAQIFKHSSLRTHTDPSDIRVLHWPLNNPNAVIPEQCSLKPHSLSAEHPFSLVQKS